MASAAANGGPVVISISSSGSEDEEEEELDGEGGGEEPDDCDDDDGGSSDAYSSEEESSGSEYDDGGDDDHADDDDDEEEEDEEEYEVEEEDEEVVKKKKNKTSNSNASTEDGDIYSKIINLLRRGKDLNALKLDDCKVYLRKHGLRVTGIKAICLQRIQEHWSIKDGNGEKLYPRSSFTINCTGDVCKGDVILFKQRVYEKFDKVTRGANIIGKRTIAGRVVKESYGAAKQQHTFTVEILWSKGVKELPTLFPLLIKGRNLYRLKTFRQHWEDEAKRSMVLSEKHKRGAAARHVRAIAKARSAIKGSKRRTCSSDNSRLKRRNMDPRVNTELKKQKEDRSRKPIAPPKLSMQMLPESSSTHFRPTFPHQNAYHGQHYLHNHFHGQNEAHYRNPFLQVQGNAIHRQYMLSNHHCPPADLHHISHFPSAQHNPGMNPSHQMDHSFVDNRFPFGWASPAHHPNRVHYHSGFPMPSAVRPMEWQKSGISPCSSPGCRELAAKGCVVSSCQTCCRRTGRPCHRHQR